MPAVDALIDEFSDALRAKDWATVRRTLHPYLHWTCADGSVIRGRANVMAMLQQVPAPNLPTAVELRDDQIYRWTA